MEYFYLLILIVLANSIPVALKDILGQKWAWPIDGGLVLPDGEPLFGHSKTLRAVIAVIPATALLGMALGFDLLTGLYIGVGALLGDLLSSFCKRRLKLAPSSQAIILDQLPESILPLLLVKAELLLDWQTILTLSLIFMLLEMLASPLLYKLKLRDRPW